MIWRFSSTVSILYNWNRFSGLSTAKRLGDDLRLIMKLIFGGGVCVCRALGAQIWNSGVSPETTWTHAITGLFSWQHICVFLYSCNFFRESSNDTSYLQLHTTHAVASFSCQRIIMHVSWAMEWIFTESHLFERIWTSTVWSMLDGEARDQQGRVDHPSSFVPKCISLLCKCSEYILTNWKSCPISCFPRPLTSREYTLIMSEPMWRITLSSCSGFRHIPTETLECTLHNWRRLPRFMYVLCGCLHWCQI